MSFFANNLKLSFNNIDFMGNDLNYIPTTNVSTTACYSESSTPCCNDT